MADSPHTRVCSTIRFLRDLGLSFPRLGAAVVPSEAADRRIILLTVFRKQRMREEAEVQRAWRAMQRCVADAHTADEE